MIRSHINPGDISMVNICRPNGALSKMNFSHNVLQQGHTVLHSHALYEGENFFGSALYLVSSLGGRSLANCSVDFAVS